VCHAERRQDYRSDFVTLDTGPEGINQVAKVGGLRRAFSNWQAGLFRAMSLDHRALL
jgi:hypothetical protein